MIDTLTGKQIGDLADALLGAYPSRDDLRIMVTIELDETLEAIADGTRFYLVLVKIPTLLVTEQSRRTGASPSPSPVTHAGQQATVRGASRRPGHRDN